jgi:hypothetical protein
MERQLKKKQFDRARVEIRGQKNRAWGIRFVSGDTVRYIEIEEGAEMQLSALLETALTNAGIKFTAVTESTIPEFEEEEE